MGKFVKARCTECGVVYDENAAAIAKDMGITVEELEAEAAENGGLIQLDDAMCPTCWNHEMMHVTRDWHR